MGFCVLLGLCNRVPHWFGGWVIVFCLIVSFCRVISVYWTKPKATHAFSPNILTLSNKPSCTSLPSHSSLYLTQSFSRSCPYVLFLISPVYQVFYSDVNKIFKSSSKHWYLIHRVLSNNVVLCLLRVPRHHLSSCFLILLTAKPPGCPCAPVCWCPLHLLLVDSIFNGYFRSFGTEFLKCWKLFGALLLLYLLQYFLLHFLCILTREIPSGFLQLWSSGFQFPLKMVRLT